MVLQSSTNLRCMNMEIMATEQLQPQLDMERKGRRTIKVCVCGCNWVEEGNNKRKVLKCWISVSHQPQGHSHETRGHQTSPSPHGEEHGRGIQAESVQMLMIAIKPNLFFFSLSIYFQSLTISTNMCMRFTATQPRLDMWKRRQMSKAEVSQL